jgi:sensor domain CHASE-containing protein
MVVTNTTDMWSAAATVFVVVALAAITVMGVWEHRNRQEEHQHIEDVVHADMEAIRAQQQANVNAIVCTSRLNLFFQTLPKGRDISWSDIPSEYWPCMPRNLVGERKEPK